MTFDPRATKGQDVSKTSEEEFRQSMAGLSRSLEERAALHRDPIAEAALRRTTVQAQFRAEARRTRWMIGIAGSALAAACVAAAIVLLATPGGPSKLAEVAQAPIPAPAPVETVAVSTPAPQLLSPLLQAVPSPDPAPPPVTASELIVAPSAFTRDDIKEIQTRLLSFGFNPGPLDGDVGRMTVGAVMNYQQQRGLAQTGQLDRALLDQLRQDPAPKVVASQPQQLHTRRAPPPQQQRRSDGLDFVRDADARLSRWFQSLSR
jgi:hypothetical protein